MKAKKASVHEAKWQEYLRLKEILDSTKWVYSEMDKLIGELKDCKQMLVKRGTTTYRVEVCDNFQEKNVKWGLAPVRRYDAKVKVVTEDAAVIPIKRKRGGK